jgi:hypothetical protein
MYSTLVVHTSEVPRILAMLNAPKPVVKEAKPVVKAAPKKRRGRPPKAKVVTPAA